MGRKGEGSMIKSISYPKSLGLPANGDKESIIAKLEQVAAREGKSLSELTVELWLNYLKVHGSGNPLHPLTNWFGNSQFSATPAFLANQENWLSFIRKQDNKSLDEIIGQSRFIMAYAAAYRDINPDRREQTGFPDFRSVLNKVRNYL
jgi:hypothetical protein